MQLTTNAKLFLAVLGIAAVTFGAVKISKAVKANKEKKDSNKLLKDDLSNWDPTKRNLSDTKCKEIADRLYELMDKTWRQEDAIVDVILNSQMSLLDLKKVYELFGTREYGTFGSPMWGSGKMYNLVQWLKEEVDGDEMEKIRPIFVLAGYKWVK